LQTDTSSAEFGRAAARSASGPSSQLLTAVALVTVAALVAMIGRYLRFPTLVAAVAPGAAARLGAVVVADLASLLMLGLSPPWAPLPSELPPEVVLGVLPSLSSARVTCSAKFVGRFPAY
jgi:hypothetical protein